MAEIIDKATRGIAARRILEDATFKEVLNDLDGLYHARWRAAETVEAREDLHRYVRVLEQLTKDLKQIALTGALEEKRIAELEGRKTRQPLNEWAIEERS